MALGPHPIEGIGDFPVKAVFGSEEIAETPARIEGPPDRPIVVEGLDDPLRVREIHNLKITKP